MRFLTSIFYAALICTLAGLAFAHDGIQMLPPDTEATTTVCPAGTARILTWDGSTALACANNITASGGTVSAPTVNATTQVTVKGAIGALNAQALTTLVNLLNTPPCPAGEALTKTGVTTFTCISVASSSDALADTTTADNTNPEPTSAPEPPVGECGPASSEVATGMPMWSTCPSQYLCGSGSVPSAVTINDDSSYGPVWYWTCTNPASGPSQAHACMAGGAADPQLYGTCLTSSNSGCRSGSVDSNVPTCQ
jgi:hypothetical protein